MENIKKNLLEKQYDVSKEDIIQENICNVSCYNMRIGYLKVKREDGLQK